MIIGIKTTDGVAKVKTKTADGVMKAVECACCICNGGPWGPGYDTLPNTVTVTVVSTGDTFTLSRIRQCLWIVYQHKILTDDYGGYYYTYSTVPAANYIFLRYGFDDVYYFSTPIPELHLSVSQFVSEDPDCSCFLPDQIVHLRVGGEDPFPYGIYQVDTARSTRDLGPIIVSP